MAISARSTVRSGGTCIAMRYSREARPSGSPYPKLKRSAEKPVRLLAYRLWPEIRGTDAKRCAGEWYWPGCGRCAFLSAVRVSAQKNGLPCLVGYLRFLQRIFGRVPNRLFYGSKLYMVKPI